MYFIVGVGVGLGELVAACATADGVAMVGAGALPMMGWQAATIKTNVKRAAAMMPNFILFTVIPHFELYRFIVLRLVEMALR